MIPEGIVNAIPHRAGLAQIVSRAKIRRRAVQRPRPNTRPQNPRFFFCGGTSGDAGSFACATGAGADPGATSIAAGVGLGTGAVADAARVSGTRLFNEW